MQSVAIPPGTGKTHTIKYLLSRLQDYTAIQLAGSQLGFVRAADRLARSLQPAIVVLEDVDLIAEDRAFPGQSPRRFLFDLLDMLDGLSDDADVVWVLTTNRPEAVETAIAARPGRIDLAVEFPLPDAAARRLLELYGRGLVLRLEDPEALICRLEGVGASFIREMLRQAAMLAPDEDEVIAVTDEHLRSVLDRLLDPANAMTRLLLGSKPERPPSVPHGQPGHT